MFKEIMKNFNLFLRNVLSVVG